MMERPGRAVVKPHTVKPKAKKPGLSFATIPKRWPGGTVACLATGPSLTAADVEYVRGKVDGVIAVNNAIDIAPWADILYACDGKWWSWHKGKPSYTGTKYAMKDDARRWHTHGVQMIRKGPKHGVDPRPDTVAHGFNSGYQAIGVAVHSGAKRIVLLGYDMKGQHFFGTHPDNTRPSFSLCIPAFKTLVKPLVDLGVEIINCTRNSAIECFPKKPLELVLPRLRYVRCPDCSSPDIEIIGTENAHRCNACGCDFGAVPLGEPRGIEGPDGVAVEAVR